MAIHLNENSKKVRGNIMTDQRDRLRQLIKAATTDNIKLIKIFHAMLRPPDTVRPSLMKKTDLDFSALMVFENDDKILADIQFSETLAAPLSE